MSWMSLLFKWNWHFNDEGIFGEGSLQSCQSCHRQQTRTFIQSLSQCWERLCFLNIDWQEQNCTCMCTTASCQQDWAYSSYLTGNRVTHSPKIVKPDWLLSTLPSSIMFKQHTRILSTAAVATTSYLCKRSGHLQSDLENVTEEFPPGPHQQFFWPTFCKLIINQWFTFASSFKSLSLY